MHEPTFKSLNELFAIHRTETAATPAQQTVEPLAALVEEAKIVLEKLGLALRELTQHTADGNTLSTPLLQPSITDGVFDGKHMITDDGVIHPVSENYASKSKLVEGDMLQMISHADGRRYFKQISRVARATATAILECIDQNSGIAATSNGTRYHILLAPLRFFRVTPGDTIQLEVPTDGGVWAAVVGKAEACYTDAQRHPERGPMAIGPSRRISSYASTLPHA